ncbi:MFS transporter, partial [Variovorax sp. Varisp62]
MFLSESGYRQEQRSGGTPQALAYFADINQYTRLYGIHEGMEPRQENEPKPTRKEKLEQQKLVRPRLYGMRTLFDFNEHFIELSNAEEEKRSLGFMLLLLGALILSVPVFGATAHFLRHGMLDWVLCLMVLGVFALEYFLVWPYFFAPAFLTSLRARYRFNRTTRKVYALRPKKYGG